MIRITFLIGMFYIFSLVCGQTSEIVRHTIDFNFNWKFKPGDETDIHTTDFNDENWQKIRLPHDWSIEHSFTQENAGGATAFLPGGIGWYRKSFELPADYKDKVTWIEFDGVYSNSEVWINGHYLGKRPYGYIPFSYDLTPYLNYGKTKNIITVKADRSAFLDCRWYPGSGIYRNVKLVSTNQVHVRQWGTQIVSSEISVSKATVIAKTDISNKTEKEKEVELVTTIYFNSSEVSKTKNKVVINAGKTITLEPELEVDKPQLWGTEQPHLYQAKHQVYANNMLSDEYSTTFGIRSIRFDKDKGFFLNGKNTLLKGVCLHHDGGLVGAAVPSGVWERRLMKLKEGGCNAIRTAHNPSSEEFLDLCDRLGFLVQVEAFDEWNNPKDKRHNYNQQKAEIVTRGYTEHFTEWAERDIKNMVLRDRNHPSVIMWSIGNEIEWTYSRYGDATGYWGKNKVGDVNYYWDEPPFSKEKIKEIFNNSNPGKYHLAETARNLTKWVKETDATRPVTANLVIPSVSNFSGYAEALDIVGLSYRQVVYDYCKQNYPDMVFLGTENWTQWHEWKPVIEKDFIAGIFLWTGINYMGESRNWPTKGSGSGLLDFAGFEKPSYQMFKSLWTATPHVHITTQLLHKSPYKWDNEKLRIVEKKENWAARKKWGWHNVNEHWNYKSGDSVAVEVYTNQTGVELFLNGKSVGTRELRDNPDRVLKWLVPYKSGKLTAKAINKEKVFEETLQTSGSFSKIEIRADRHALVADAYDVVHISAQLADSKGNPIKHREKEIEFRIEGNIRLLGIDNGSPQNVQDHQSNKITTFGGKCLLILQSNLEPGEVSISAISGNVKSETLKINIK